MTTDKTKALFDNLARAVHNADLVKVHGKVVQVLGTIIKAAATNVKVGELCRLVDKNNGTEILAEIVGFNEDYAIMTPMGEMVGISSDTLVIPTGKVHNVPVGPDLLGRVLDGLGRPIDGLDKPINPETYYPVYNESPNPMTRNLIEAPLPLGVKALDGLLTCGIGQRMGIFAAAGGGKSTLLGMLTKGAQVDVTVLALIGERGREVREFIEHELGPEGLKKAVLVISTSDRPAVERSKAAYVATAIAEYFRDQGKRVLLMMDSVTRFARAQREIGLAAGEPPTRRGFPPSVFADLPKLLERAGHNDKGSITGLYTVLVEGDDMSEPIADETRGILDGHIILSRKLAARNHYPAIDILASKSRVMNNIVGKDHLVAAGKLNELLAKYNEVELLVRIGEYSKGSDALADEAISKIERLNGYLKQPTDLIVPFDDAVNQLKTVI